MTEMEFRKRISQMAGSVPSETHQAFLLAVSKNQKRTDVKWKKTQVLVIALVLMTIMAVAVAASITYNQEWWWQNRIVGGKESNPERYQAIAAHLVDHPAQSQSKDELVAITIQDVAWAPEADALTISFKAAPKDPEHYELHGMWDLDSDGNYMGEGGSVTETEAGEAARAIHWLWRNDVDLDSTAENRYGHIPGYGPVMSMMDDGSKHLLLVDFGHEVALTDASPIMSGGVDEFRISTGEVIFVIECDLTWLHEEYDQKMLDMAKRYPDQSEYYEEQIALAQKGRAQVQSHQGIRCNLAYSVVEYTEGMDDGDLYGGGKHGTVEFVIQGGEDEDQ